MLTIGRRPGEKVILAHGDARIEVLVYQTTNHMARICIDAPKDVIIVRAEIEDRHPVHEGWKITQTNVGIMKNRKRKTRARRKRRRARR